MSLRMTRKVMKRFLSIACSIAALSALKGASNQIRYIKAYGRNYVYLRDVANYYGMKYFIWKEKCGIYSRYSRIEFNYDKKEGRINGTKAHFLHPPFLKGWDAFISEQDFLLMVDPVLRNKALPSHRMRVIAIDPGHGGGDRGAKGSLYEEKALVLSVAYKLRAALIKKGYQVIMTRDRDVFPSLKQRPEYAKKRHADIFISLHANSTGKTYVHGIETFSATPAGAASTHDSKPKYKVENGNSFDKNNSRLAYEIHKSLISKTKAVDRGVKKARFLVIREACCPAVLVELGFLSNRREERALGRSSYQQALADAIAEGVVNYHRALIHRR